MIMNEKKKEKYYKLLPTLVSSCFVNTSYNQQTIVSTSSNFQLMEIAARAYKRKTKIVITTPSSILFQIARKALHLCSDTIEQFQLEEDRMTVKFSKVTLEIRRTRYDMIDVLSFVEDDLDGVLYFADFTTQEYIDYHLKQLTDILDKTKKNCLISIAISNNSGIKIENTLLPTILAKTRERTITIIDLTTPESSEEYVIAEFAEQVINQIRK